MKGTIILPKYLKPLWTPKSGPKGLDFNNVLTTSAPLYYAMRDVLKFELKYADEVDVDSNNDIVIMFGIPYHNRPKLIPGLLDLNKKIKLVMFPGDIHCHNNILCLKNRIQVFKRCDLIIIHAYEYFEKMYSKFLPKHKFMFNYFSPHERYVQLPLNNNPIMRCLLPGAVNPKIYPLRSFVKKQSNNIDCKRAIGNKYAELLNSYFCCLTSSSIFNYALAKHFEIPAAGSLLLADETSDLTKAGFVPNYHYVPVTKNNAIAKIKHCLKKPHKYEHIRKQGMEFVRKNHSMINRIDELKTIFERIFI